jgi:hypothetical protein
MKTEAMGYIDLATEEWLRAPTRDTAGRILYAARKPQRLAGRWLLALCARGQYPRRIRFVGACESGIISDSVLLPRPIALQELGIIWSREASQGKYLNRDDLQLLMQFSPPTTAVSVSVGASIRLDAATRKVIENRAIEIATSLYADHYRIEIHGKPYDLKCTAEGDEVHVEVKGSSIASEVVILTPNEVSHARTAPCRVDFVHVTKIQVAYDVFGTPTASGGGVSRHIKNWTPSDSDLVATEYEYRLPRT